jgi:hypothetical protein
LYKTNYNIYIPEKTKNPNSKTLLSRIKSENIVGPLNWNDRDLFA